MKALLRILASLLRVVQLLLGAGGDRSVRLDRDVPFYDQGGRNHWHWRQW